MNRRLPIFVGIGVLVLAVLALTFVGTFCRGPYWHLYWPWETWPVLPTRI